MKDLSADFISVSATSANGSVNRMWVEQVEQALAE